jgi:hypothetical protein
MRQFLSGAQSHDRGNALQRMEITKKLLDHSSVRLRFPDGRLQINQTLANVSKVVVTLGKEVIQQIR